MSAPAPIIEAALDAFYPDWGAIVDRFPNMADDSRRRMKAALEAIDATRAAYRPPLQDRDWNRATICVGSVELSQGVGRTVRL